MRNLLVAQSGGPTAAINATVAGVVSCAVLSGKVDHIYGAVNGIEGVLAEKFLDLGKKLDSAEKISLLMQTPAAALGSCRNGSLPGLWICGKISGSNLCRAGERLPCI